MTETNRFEMNTTDMAMCLGVTRQTMYRFIKAGCDWHTVEGKPGKFFDLVKSIQWYIRYQADIKDKRIVDLEAQIAEYDDTDSLDEYNDYRGQREKSRALIEEINLNVLRKKYVKAEDINRDFRELGNLFRLTVDRMKGKYKKTPHVKKAFQDLTDTFLQEVQNYIKGISNKSDEGTLFEEDGTTCISPTKKGTTCTKPAWQDGLCKQHHPDYKKVKK